MGVQPDGWLQAGCTYRVLVAKGVSVGTAMIVAVEVSVETSTAVGEAVKVAVGNSREIVGGIGVGVACEGRLSDRAREMPPMTRITETSAMMRPLPNCRKDC